MLPLPFTIVLLVLPLSVSSSGSASVWLFLLRCLGFFVVVVVDVAGIVVVVDGPYKCAVYFPK